MDEVFERFKTPLLLILGGLIFMGTAVIYLNKEKLKSETPVVNSSAVSSGDNETKKLVVEVSGGVEKPGVYDLPSGSRIQDALITAGGLSRDADRDWVERTVNQAAKVTDGQKIYIPVKQSDAVIAKNGGVDQTGSPQVLATKSGLININTASLSELDALPGIGPVYGQNIIEQRPYSNTEELLTRGVLKKFVYDKIKDLISVY
jgi:competence protein ComEA